MREKQLPVMNEPILKQGNCPTISNQMKSAGNCGGTMCIALACKKKNVQNTNHQLVQNKVTNRWVIFGMRAISLRQHQMGKK